MAPGLTDGNLLTGTPTVTVTVYSGTDPSPMAILNGAATRDATNTQVLVPVAPTIDNMVYQIMVLCATSNLDITLELPWLLPVFSNPAGQWPQGPPAYNDAVFRQQFPAFANATAYPATALQFAWNMGANWMSQKSAACWGVGAYNSAKLQQAADLMGAVMVYQLYGPAVTGGQPTYSEAGEAPGAVESATEGSVTAQFQLPEIGSSAFSSMLLASPPYGRMLLALLQVSASIGPYIPSGRFSRVPP
jgi:hypothetical protein